MMFQFWTVVFSGGNFVSIQSTTAFLPLSLHRSTMPNLMIALLERLSKWWRTLTAKRNRCAYRPQRERGNVTSIHFCVPSKIQTRQWFVITVDQKIFVVKKFSWVAPSTKIKCTTFFFATNYYIYGIFVHMHILHAAAFRSLTLTKSRLG